MCFGNQTTQQQTNTPSPVVQQAGQSAFNFAQSLASQPFSAPLQGIAPLDANQSQAINNIAGMANAPNADNPFYSAITNDYTTYGCTALPTIQPQSIVGSGTSPYNTNLSSYIDPNLSFEVQPILNAISQQSNIAKTGAGGIGSQATAAGAFGDARQGVQNAQEDYNAMLAAGQATGQAYQNAFNTAASLRGADVSNVMGAQSANEQIAQQQLQNLLGGANALTNLASYTTGQGLNLGQALLQAGGTQQQNQQQALSAFYNQQLQNLLGPYQYQIPALNSTLSALTPTQPSTQTVQQPNNAGWNILGSVAGSAAQGGAQALALGALLSDERLKLDMEQVGETNDGLPIYSYRYLPAIDPAGTPRIGLSAQDVEKVYPDAVSDIGGYMAVDYGKATAFARLLGSAFAGDLFEHDLVRKPVPTFRDHARMEAA